MKKLTIVALLLISQTVFAGSNQSLLGVSVRNEVISSYISNCDVIKTMYGGTDSNDGIEYWRVFCSNGDKYVFGISPNGQTGHAKVERK